MSKQIEKDIIELVTKWHKVRAVFPDSWSYVKQLSSTSISYRTYNSGSIAYINVEITHDSIDYKIELRSGEVIISAPITKKITAEKALQDLETIYKESTSIESQAEGIASIRKEIADKKQEITRLNKDIKSLTNRLTESTQG